MKHSIRLRFTALIFLVLALLMAGLLLMNSFGLERFYRRQKVRDLEYATGNSMRSPWRRAQRPRR